MKEPKRVIRALKGLNRLIEMLHYYMGDCKEFKSLVRNELTELENLIKDLSMDQKKHNIRLAKRLKDKWDKERE